MTQTARNLVPLSIDSKADWFGIEPNRFRYTERAHFASKDLLKTIEGHDHKFLGKKHFEPKFGETIKERICLRVFPDIHNKETDLNNLKTLNKLAYVPPKKKVGLKLAGTQSSFFKKTKNRSMIMPDSFISMKNMRSQYIEQPNQYRFFGEDRRHPIAINTTRSHHTSNTLNWKDKDRVEEKTEEIKIVADLFEWEAKTMRQAVLTARVRDEMQKSSRRSDKGNYTERKRFEF